DQDGPGYVRAHCPEVLQPAPGLESNDVQPDRNPERHHRGNQDVGPVVHQGGIAPSDDVGADDRGRHQQVGIVEDVVHPIGPATHEPVSIAEGAFGPEVNPAFLGKAGGEITDRQALRDEKQESREDPHRERAGTGGGGGRRPAQTQHRDDVEEDHVAEGQHPRQLDVSRGHVGVQHWLSNSFRHRLSSSPGNHALRYNRCGSSTSRSRDSSASLGGWTCANVSRRRSCQPTRCSTSVISTPGYSAASTSSPVSWSASRMALSVITRVGPAPGMPYSRLRRPLLHCPGLVMKSTRSGKARRSSRVITRVRRAWIAISAAPPLPGNRTLGRSYSPITVVLMFP